MIIEIAFLLVASAFLVAAVFTAAEWQHQRAMRDLLPPDERHGLSEDERA